MEIPKLSQFTGFGAPPTGHQTQFVQTWWGLNFEKNVEPGMGLVTANWDHHAHTPVAFTYMKVLKIMQPPIWLRKERERERHTHTQHSLIRLDEPGSD
jgi:hypothetical protein